MNKADMAHLYYMLSISSFLIASGCLIFSVILWFGFDVWKIIGDMTGRNAKKSVEQIRKENGKRAKFTLLENIVLVHTDETIEDL